VEEVIVRTLEETPEGATHWSKRELARQTGHLADQHPALRRPLPRDPGQPRSSDHLRKGREGL
jgi:hypothetical protein